AADKAAATDNVSRARHFNYGHALFHLGRFEEAIEPLKKSLGATWDAEAWNDVGWCQYKLGRREEAMESYRTSLRADPKYWRAHANLGEALLDAERAEEARASFEEAQRLRPTDAGQAFNLARAWAAA